MFLKKKKKVISFLVSGKGSNFNAVAEKIISGYIRAEAGILISSSSEAPALQKSANLKIKSMAIEPKKFKTKEEHEAEIIKFLELSRTDLIVAAGYMRILTPAFINRYRHRIINIHPSLLPSFPGKNAQQQAFNYGVKISGCTTHFIDEGTDTGPIIMQAAVDISNEDDINTLSTKILKEEHRILIESVKLYCEDKLIVKNNKVLIKN
ncbi:MAG TPA: phosphoribosylglycinamide formyltransferase [Spirochaetota bacterium]|nr:phosphoribosylglycinamide formyltransferase [Spirochaetota bacterium]